MLGEFEYLLITTAARLGNEAYGAVIREVLARSSIPVIIVPAPTPAAIVQHTAKAGS